MIPFALLPDTVRPPHLQGNPPALARMLLTLLTALRGGACIYEGEELGLTEAQLCLFKTSSDDQLKFTSS